MHSATDSISIPFTDESIDHADDSISETGVSQKRLTQATVTAQQQLLAERQGHGAWTGELSTSALSTATAIMAMEQVRIAVRSSRVMQSDESVELPATETLFALMANGADWLAGHQNSDGGWGDTTKSLSNISTTMLCRAALKVADEDRFDEEIWMAERYIQKAGGVKAVIERYGNDRTFSTPILMHCALAGLVDWSEVPQLPFELACVPATFYRWLKLPVVSYALPALIAIGIVRHHHRPTRNLPLRWLRNALTPLALKILNRIQPTNGGFLEATPLTSFVTMSLAASGHVLYPVSKLGLKFILNSKRADGSWPIDTNLATWVTTLSINALDEDLPDESHAALREFLLKQQYREVHPYTQAAPGGWAWTDLPGGVPDADDTPGAILALLKLIDYEELGDVGNTDREALALGVHWLLDQQNADGGWPTFCRGWGALPFDRSASDITAHCLRALHAWRQSAASYQHPFRAEVDTAIRSGFAYLQSTQQADGSWLPLWFGNQHAADETNPTYGTSRVLLAYEVLEMQHEQAAERGYEYLRRIQNADGGWGGIADTPSSVEESALAVEALAGAMDEDESLDRGVNWLIERVEADTFCETSPIGFYFAKLWYFEKLYPMTSTASALRRAGQRLRKVPVVGEDSRMPK
ncbi:prenyltransferase/squalene oxidase repeat-containing protein [Calycomorphotria hydatis]|uniref:Squalene--hopene cyclase n=1 Tax=Calycomorphotria hydatis TaxID=2528027 RepID=A0A517T6N0_9PLAN|nr:prenyltransferase/squalene oxidase repeat-containing protein [Calycomorphotria hydatis]QDT64029.1 Squalene--hopene cyclase [Calycomorphotria hydatis]